MITNEGLKAARRIAVLIIGATIILVGVALLVLPGPGIVVIFVGLGVLAAEFAWARRLLVRAKQAAREAASFNSEKREGNSDERDGEHSS